MHRMLLLPWGSVQCRMRKMALVGKLTTGGVCAVCSMLGNGSE